MSNDDEETKNRKNNHIIDKNNRSNLREQLRDDIRIGSNKPLKAIKKPCKDSILNTD